MVYQCLHVVETLVTDVANAVACVLAERVKVRYDEAVTGILLQDSILDSKSLPLF